MNILKAIHSILHQRKKSPAEIVETLVEARDSEKLSDFERRAAANQLDDHEWTTYFRMLERARKPLPVGERTRDYRIKNGDWRRFDQVIARMPKKSSSRDSWPRGGVWRGKWVMVHRWNDDITYDINTEQGMDPDSYDGAWLLGTGSGFSTITHLVNADSMESAYEECEEEWPDEFIATDEHDPDVRVAQRVEDWVIARKAGLDYELLDGTIIPFVDIV